MKNTSKKNDNFSNPVTKGLSKTKTESQSRFTALFLMASPPVTRDRREGEGCAETQELMLLGQSRTLWQTG